MPEKKPTDKEDKKMTAMVAAIADVNARQPLSGAKTERLAVRATESAKLLIERASHLSGRTVSDFVLEKATEAAVKTIADYEQVVLGENQREAFFNALISTHEPSKRVLDAAERYKKKFGVK